jgi:ribosomal protein S18 acetylase RimI-like enzyme
MQHILNNPAWNALNTNNSNLANGNNEVKYFAREVSPFFGLRENSEANFQILHDMIPHNGPLLLVTHTETAIPTQWKVLNIIKGIQMIYNGQGDLTNSASPLVPLTEQHVPQMLTLTKLTNPGPFAAGTINFGHYHGIFDGDQLVAMAGQRLHAGNYAEISAVCTHPDYLGRGYAKQLLQHQISRIQAAHETPFLHVRDDNHRAIQVYQSLGFETRTAIYFYVMVKEG